MPFDFKSYEGKVSKKILRHLKRGRSSACLVRAMQDIQALAEETLEAHIDSEEKSHIACAAGCGTCCMVNVAVLFPEAVTIVDYLNRTRSGRELSALVARLDELHVQTRWLDDEDRVYLREPCAFLDASGSCSIYPVRPLLCRSITSTNPESCRQALSIPLLEEAPMVMMNLFQKSVMEQTYCAVAQGLKELGLEHRAGRLTEQVRALLEKPGTVVDYLTQRVGSAMEA